MIEFDSEDHIRMLVACLLPFAGLKTAAAVTEKPVSHFRHKTTWPDECKYESINHFKASLNLCYG